MNWFGLIIFLSLWGSPFYFLGFKNGLIIDGFFFVLIISASLLSELIEEDE